MFAPAQNPALNLFQTSERHAQFDFAVGESLDLLRRVPLPLTDEPGRERIEVDEHGMTGLSLENTKTVAQVLRDRKIGRAPESAPRIPQLSHPGQGKRPNLPADEIEPEQIPLIFHAAEMVGLDPPCFVPGAAELFVFKLNLMRVEDRPADRLEKFKICDTRADPTERNGRIHITPLEPDAVLESFSDLPERGSQRSFKRSASILLQSLLGDEERDDFPSETSTLGKWVTVSV
jgi:hypothetical protein